MRYLIALLFVTACGGSVEAAPDCKAAFLACEAIDGASVDGDHCQVVGAANYLANVTCPGVKDVPQAGCAPIVVGGPLVSSIDQCSAEFSACTRQSTPRYSESCYVGHYACDEADGTIVRCSVSLPGT